MTTKSGKISFKILPIDSEMECKYCKSEWVKYKDIFKKMTKQEQESNIKIKSQIKMD